MSRKITDLVPELQEIYRRFAIAMSAAGLSLMVTRTYSTQAEQDALYEQGRTKPGKIVTWTRKSKHTERRVFDIAILKDGKPVWESKIDVDNDGIPDYTEAGCIGISLGLVWGGSWQDYCHFEFREVRK